MNQRDDFFITGSAAPVFQGDRTLTLRSIPANVRILKATVTVTPQTPPFTHDISLDGMGETFGATKNETTDWVEVDFHARRTLVSVVGDNLGKTTLQADFGGGVYVNISRTGSVQGPPPDLPFQLSDTSTSTTQNPLPGLAVTKFKLTRFMNGAPGPAAPRVTRVTIRAVPSNVSLRAGDLGPFWTNLGDMTQAETTPDFATVLQGFLAKAVVENGFYVVPFILHSDSLGKLQVTVNTEFVLQQSAIPGGLKDVVLPYDIGSIAQPQADVLEIKVPRNTRIVPQQTSARIKGAFDETRVAYGPTGEVQPTTEVAIPAATAQAQPILLTDPAAVTALDLLLKAVGGSARLRLEVRGDLAGKPDDASLLPQAAELALDPKPNGAFAWVSVPLSAEFRFQPSTHYWLVLQTLQGNINWSADPAHPPNAGMQRTQDGGLSWRIATPVSKNGASAAGAVAGPLAGYFRLRSRPANFQVPIEVQAGSGKNAVRIKLDRFAPMGRVDFSAGTEIAQALNGTLEKMAQDAPPPCPEGDHIANGDFQQIVALADEKIVPADWTLTSGSLSLERNGEAISLSGIDPNQIPTPAALSQVVPVSASCHYEFSFLALADESDPDAVGEILWLNQQCGLEQTDSIPLQTRKDSLRHRARFKAPAGATQAEVRFRVPQERRASIATVSLQVVANAVDNSDLELLQDQVPVGWSLNPGAPTQFKVRSSPTGTLLRNEGTTAVEVFQKLEAKPGQEFAFEFNGVSVHEAKFQGTPQVELRWLGSDNSAVVPPTVFIILPENSARTSASGAVPPEASSAEVRLLLPSKGILFVQNISLQFSERQLVPLTFIAQAPGQLTVSDLRVGYEHVPTLPPPVPASGLCPSTPPGKVPGEKDCDSSYCCCCGDKDTMKNAAPAVTPANRPAMIGTCATCGSTMVLHGRLPLGSGKTLAAFPAIPTIAAKLAASPKSASRSTPPPLTAIEGIGERRATQLMRAGIDSIEKLALASPAAVADAVTGVSIKNALHYIDAARDLLGRLQKELVGREPTRLPGDQIG